MITTIAVIAAITEKKKVMAAIIWKPLSSDLSDRCRCDHYDHILFSKDALLKAGFHMIAAIAELFFLSDRSNHMETSLKLRIFTK